MAGGTTSQREGGPGLGAAAADAQGAGAATDDLMARIQAAEASDQGSPSTAEGWKEAGGEAYARKDFQEAARCYGSALELCAPSSELAVLCLNNRAACYAQLKEHARVIEDASRVIERQPANVKALLRRMVALDALGRVSEALEDAGGVLTLEPKNPHALQVVAKRRQSLGKPVSEGPRCEAPQVLSVFLFSEDRPLHCYACLRALRSHLKGAVLHVYVFWQASDRACTHSYQLLQCLPTTSRLPQGAVDWIDASGGGLFAAFSRTVNRLSVEGRRHVLLLADAALFHTDVDVSAALRVLDERREVFAARLDVNPRVDYFPEAGLFQSAPRLQHFSSDPRILLWTRTYDKSKQAYEAVPRESGWDAILDWTASIVRAEHVQHFFSALLPPLNTAKEVDDKAADWLSRRQRMKRSEVSHKSACYEAPLLVALEPAHFGGPVDADLLLRRHLLAAHGLDGSGGPDRMARLATQVGWTARELSAYFAGAEVGGDLGPRLQGLLEPERYRAHYWSSVRVPAAVGDWGLPRPLEPPAPLVSWLVPVRNAEHFLRGCHRSMAAQQGVGAGSVEVVFVDDASEDGSLAVLRKLEAEFPNVRLVDSPSRCGVAAALALGWELCRGDFVARLDADDEAEPDRLLKQLRYMEQHRTLSVVGGRVQPFWTEERKCTIEKATEKADGRVAAVAWREFHGNQTSRQREQLTFSESDSGEVLVDGPAEYHNCRVLRIGGQSLALEPTGWRAALQSVQGGMGEVLLERRDPLEPPSGSRLLHPLLVRAGLLFENPVAGTTALLRRAHFPEAASPFPVEDAECHWAWLALGPSRHAANLADPVVRARRYAGNRAQLDAGAIQESQYAAVQHHLAKACRLDASLEDAAALLHFRGPKGQDQGEKVLELLRAVEEQLVAQFVHPREEDKGAFWRDFVESREAALVRGIHDMRARFKALADEVARVITNGDKSPRQHRSRTPPR